MKFTKTVKYFQWKISVLVFIVQKILDQSLSITTASPQQYVFEETDGQKITKITPTTKLFLRYVKINIH